MFKNIRINRQDAYCNKILGRKAFEKQCVFAFSLLLSSSPFFLLSSPFLLLSSYVLKSRDFILSLEESSCLAASTEPHG